MTDLYLILLFAGAGGTAGAGAGAGGQGLRAGAGASRADGDPGAVGIKFRGVQFCIKYRGNFCIKYGEVQFCNKNKVLHFTIKYSRVIFVLNTRGSILY